MFIKRLELLGFKTFADKTQIELSDGITAIVGPNGAGKSNIADAILWVLGESNVRNLRGQRTTDVIFSGSEKRRAISLAEASLTLDNSCGTLPLDFNEITITRRSYRSGEGEYFINKTRCRLKDIYELFLDTGIGREAYSIVSQGEIDAVLSAKPEERRELFEEAAGIKKYRYRREEALRKLERTDANLRRVCDIMAEIGGQLEPLAGQSEQARRFNELQSRLWDIEIGLLIRDLKRFTANLDEVRESKKGSGSQIEEYDIRLAELDGERTRLSSELARLEEDVETARRVTQAVSANTQRLESKLALTDERLKAADSTRERADADIAELERKNEETCGRIAQLEADEETGALAESRARQAVEAESAEIARLEGRLEGASRTVNDRKASYLDLARELAAKRNALQNSKDRIEQLDAAISRWDQGIAQLEKLARDAAGRQEQAAAGLESSRRRIGGLDAEIERLTGERKAAESSATDLRAAYAELSRDLTARSSRLATLREMAEAHEGFYEGVRSVMDAARSGAVKGGFTVVADVLDVPEGYELAIETALGASVQDIIADSIEQAKNAIAHLKANRAGRATFLPLDSLRAPESEIRGAMQGRAGFLGIAAKLVKFHARYDPAVRTLLGRTVVVDNVDNAVSLARELAGWSRIVTLEGELIFPTGALTGGTAKGRSPGLLSRKQAVDSLQLEIKSLEKSGQRLGAKLAEAESRMAEAASEIETRQNSLDQERAVLADHRRLADLSAHEAERAARQLDAEQLERGEAERLRGEETANVARLDEELQAAGREDEDLDKKVSGAQQDIEDTQAQLAAAREKLMRSNVELAGCVERNAAARAALQEARAAGGEFHAALASRRSQLDGAGREIQLLADERDTVDCELRKQRELSAAAEKTLDDLVAARGETSRRSNEVDSQIRDTSAARNRLASEFHEADVREARLEVQISQITERLLQEYELGCDQAMQWPEEEIEVERGTVTEVARLRREIKEMGPVNTGAVQEYERVKERWDFLAAQRADLDSAKAQINEAIGEIDAGTRGLFMETFETAASNFDLMFKRLFGGGTTRLSLTDPNDLLGTGVEVAVQPPGKKMQDMALLSGGERALTATALLFALLMVKPSPFVVLDEVDAPLDESNVERFAEVLKEFARDSQFIVVTHNRATMEAADSLYGVTMQEPGVSKLISVRLAAEGPVEREVAEAVTS